MANDESIASLIEIEDGSDAVAKTLRQNFKYLDDRITAQATNISNKETTSHKNAANGYCGLDANGSIPETILTKVTSSIVGAIFRVNSIYVTTDTDSTTCPIASLIPGSTWVLVAANKALWTGSGSNANTTIAAGLPNITGVGMRVSPEIFNNKGCSGAIYASGSNTGGGGENGDRGFNYTGGFNFDASRSNSIYGKSSTVQPPAYVVNVWRRTA
jgi:hypothetical protein